MATKSKCLSIVKNLSDEDVKLFNDIHDEYVAKGEPDADKKAVNDVLDVVMGKRSEIGVIVTKEGGALAGYASPEKEKSSLDENLDKPEIKANDRRGDNSHRADIDKMSSEDKDAAIAGLRKQLKDAEAKALTHPLTKIPNFTAFEQSDKKAFAVSIDMDSLGYVNDNVNHTAADDMLKLMAKALEKSGSDVYHKSGDEFIAQGDDQDLLDSQMESALDMLNDVVITGKDGEGVTHTIKGVFFSYGKGNTYEQADANLHPEKERREREGLRTPKGAEPKGHSTDDGAKGLEDKSAASPNVKPQRTAKQLKTSIKGKIKSIAKAKTEKQTDKLKDELEVLEADLDAVLSQSHAEIEADLKSVLPLMRKKDATLDDYNKIDEAIDALDYTKDELAHYGASNPDIAEFFDDTKYSKAPTIPNSFKTIEEAKAYIIKQDPKLEQMINDGEIIVTLDGVAIPDGSETKVTGQAIQGAFLNGKIYITANGNDKDTILSTVYHELTHSALDQSGLKNFLSPKVHAELFKQLENIKKLSSRRKLKGEEARFWQTVQNRVSEAGTPNKDILEETAGYATTIFLEGGALPKNIKTWVQKLITALKMAIFKRTGIMIGKLKPADINAIAEAYVAHVNKGKQVDHGSSRLMNSAKKAGYEGNDTGEAKEWLAAKAKGLDMSLEGRMKRAKAMGFDVDRVWYHGSPKDLVSIKSAVQLGMKGGNNGIYVTTDTDISSHYAGQNGANYPLFIKSSNPLDANNKIAFTRSVKNFLKSIISGKPHSQILHDYEKTEHYSAKDKRKADAFNREYMLNYSDDIAKEIQDAGYDSVTSENNLSAGYSPVTVLFNPNQLRSIHAAFDPDNADSSNLLASMTQTFNTFFSGMGKALDSKMPNSISAKQLAQQLQNEGTRGKWGIKAEEVEWTGIVEWLQDQKGKVTKEQVQEFIEANQVVVEEVELGGVEKTLMTVEDILNIEDDVTVTDPSNGNKVEHSELEGFYDLTDELLVSYENDNPTKFKDYTVKGEAKDYRELLLTLPASQLDDSKLIELRKEQANHSSKYNPKTDYYDRDTEKPTEWAIKDREIRSAIIALEKGTAAERKESGAAGRRDEYKSSHFDEKNIIAHIRFDERTDADDNRVLFINEIQSDWHQAGRKEGYKNNLDYEDEYKTIDAEIGVLLGGYNEEWVGSEGDVDQLQMSEGDNILYDKLFKKRASLRSQSAANRAMPSNAPFKGNAWINLAMKRMIRYATDNGFDKVAWATGEQSAELYSLDKFVERINVGVNADGRMVRIVLLDDNVTKLHTVNDEGVIISSGDSKDKSLADVIGKEMADKIMQVEDRETFEGDGLKVGGEGMRSFYDKTIPNLTKKYIKKWGGKVESVKFSNDELPTRKDWIDAGYEGQPFTIVRDLMTDGDESVVENKHTGEETTFETRELANEYIDEQTALITGINQQGFTITDEMKASVSKGQPLFSKASQKRSSWRDEKGTQGLGDTTIEALNKSGRPPSQPIKEKVAEKFNEAKDRWKTKFRQGTLDQYDSIKSVLGDKRSWMLAQMSGNSGGIVEMALVAGQPYMHEDGVVQIHEDKKALADILEPLGDEGQLFLMWIAGNRADKINKRSEAATAKIETLKKEVSELKAEANKYEAFSTSPEERAANKDLRKQAKKKEVEIKALKKVADVKERLFSESDITELKNLDSNKREDGSVDNGRKARYEKARKEFESLHNSFVQLGVDTGLVSKEDARIWKEQGFYVPFYRIADEEANSFGIPSASGMIGQNAYKKMKGADMQLDNLLLNTVMNWNHLASASLKNQAAQATLDSAVDVGLAVKLKHKKASKKQKGSKDVFVRVNGKEQWYTIDDTTDGKLVLESISSLNYQGLNGAAMKVARKFKRALTYGVTASPEFKIANLIRDSIQAIAVGDMSVNVAKNLKQGWSTTKKMSSEIVQATAAGGVFGDSGYIHGNDPDAIAILMADKVKQENILNTNLKLKNWWNHYQDLGARLENVNRQANIQQKLAKGDNLLEANFAGRDHLDFQRSGAYEAVRFLTQVTPFLNARMQGLDKMYRAFEDPKQRAQMASVILAYSAASVLLYLYMMDDEEYKEAEDWERDTYHLVKLPNTDVMVRIPRPFEVGFVANMVERGVEQFANPDVEFKVWRERLQHGIIHTLSFNLPQIIAPAIDIRSNKSSFTGRNIESMTMQRLSPKNRVKSYTSQTAKGLSHAMSAVMPEGSALSPIQIDYAVQNYLGWMGSTGLDLVDLLARPIMGEPSEPSMQLRDYPVIGRFVREAKGNNARQITELYDNREYLNTMFADIQQYKANGEIAKYRKEMRDNRSDLAMRRAYNKAGLRMSRLRNKSIKIGKSNLSSEAKRDQMNRLSRQQIEIAKRVIDKFKPKGR